MLQHHLHDEIQARARPRCSIEGRTPYVVLGNRTCHTMWPDGQEAISKLINERFERDILHSDIVVVWKGKKEVV